MITKGEVVEWLVDWFSVHGHLQEGVVSVAENYLEKGWLDSFGIIELITDVEGKFDVRLNENSFSDPRFPTIEGLSELIIEKEYGQPRRPKKH
jgi:acyl carrier protein